MTKLTIYVIASIIVVITCVIIWQLVAYRAPQPAYQVIKKDQSIEVREYPALLVAEVSIQGERYAAIQSGFRKLADFIFGNNNRHEKIAMTAPVLQQPAAQNQMKGVSSQQNNNWIIRFIMPTNFKLNSLPKPGNPDVKFVEIPARRYAVIVFRGWNSDSNLREHLQLLLNYCRNHHINTTGNPLYAFYNPPWILPFLRRNEILVELTD